MIDLRSDTVTQPTPAMRRAMAEAPVGDDVFGEDPTINQLERTVAQLLGKEGAMFVPSGTMANQLAVKLQTQPGDEVILEAGAHVLNSEAGGAASISGVTCRPIRGQRGIFTAEDLLAALRAPDVHHAPARLVCVENTHNGGGGRVWPMETLAKLAEAAHAHGLNVHMDGARLWNAAVASGIPESDFARHCDTVGVCFSKGLGAPVGSALAGSHELIARGRRFRKMLGGGMRQGGILAAAALYALEHNRHRMADDHANARRLADGLIAIDGITIDGPIETNIVRFRAPGADAKQIVQSLRAKDVLLFPTGPDSFRAVTHLMITQPDIDTALAAAREVLQPRRK